MTAPWWWAGQALALAVELGDSALQVRVAYRLGQVYETIGDFGQGPNCCGRTWRRRTGSPAQHETTDPVQVWLARP